MRTTTQWRARPVATIAVKAAILLVPMMAGTVAGLVVAGLLPVPAGLALRVGWAGDSGDDDGSNGGGGGGTDRPGTRPDRPGSDDPTAPDPTVPSGVSRRSVPEPSVTGG